ncbi:MAG TPA: PIN domain-containing protein [Polyangia bacterium]|nr:PIN domain-containing protein [Polyangia bacterium]
MTPFILDAGALIALDRGAIAIRAYVLAADNAKATLYTSSAAVAQVWRGGSRQARLARFLGSDLVTEIPLDPEAARRIGVLAAAVGSRDVVDGHVALLALDRNAVVLSSDPHDIARWGVPDERIVRC